MRKFTLLMTFLATTMLSFGADISGTYTVGTGGTYATLGAAVTDLKAGTITGNVVLEIISDLTEPSNIGFGLNTNGFSITIRPDADADRTILFTQTTDNGSSSGALVIGLSNLASWSSLVVTNNIIIDGWPLVGGTSQRLIFTTASTSFTGSTPIHIIGDVNNVSIKNCKFI